MHIYTDYFAADTTCPKSTLRRVGKKTQKTKICFSAVSLSFFPLCNWGPGKKKKRAEEKKTTVCCSTFEGVFIGLGSVVLRVQASSCFSSFVLSKVCPMHWGFVCGGRRHITFCLLSQAGGWGIRGWGGHNRGGTKSKLIEGHGSSKLRCTKAYKALLHVELCQM